LFKTKKTQPVLTLSQTDIGFIQNQFTYTKHGKLQTHRLPRQFAYEEGARTIRQFERKISYTNDNQIAFLSDPDSGSNIFIYDKKSALLRFQVHYGNTGKFGYVLIYDYDAYGSVNRISVQYHPQLTDSAGHPVDLQDQAAVQSALTPMADIQDIPKSTLALLRSAQVLTSSVIANTSAKLNQRGRLSSANGQMFFTYADNGLLSTKRSIIYGIPRTVHYGWNIQGYLSTLTYPETSSAHPPNLVYERDQFNRILTIKDVVTSEELAAYTYRGSTQQIDTESIGKITRQYHYNLAGQLVSISDDVLTQSLTYTEDAFSASQYYTQVIASAATEPKWTSQISDKRALTSLEKKLIKATGQSAEDVIKFIQCLTDRGYINDHGFITKQLNIYSAFDIPTDILDLAKALPVLDAHPTTLYSGHQYAYDTQGQIRMAKFQIGPQNNALRFSPGAIQSYLKIPQPEAQSLYNDLIKANLLTPDGRWLLELNQGLVDALASDSSSAAQYLKAHPIGLQNCLLSYYVNQMALNQSAFAGYYLAWIGIKVTDASAPVRIQEANEAWSWLQTKGFLSASLTPTGTFLPQNLVKLLTRFTDTVPLNKCVEMLQFYIAHEIGNHINDMAVYAGDPNGNMSLFEVGNTQFKLVFSPDSNQLIQLLDMRDEVNNVYDISHDDNGNVNRAGHHNISHIQYNPYSNRPVTITFSDGGYMKLEYDYKGERTLKQVYDVNANLVSEIQYCRDEQGRVLTEWETNNLAQHITHYIYGPGNAGLIAIQKDAQLYRVIRDHHGSIRVLTDANGDVVFAAHYLAYGQQTQVFGDTSLIRYGYLGQEFDSETELYNFHARLYDPSIGRFYQPDPKNQYASPYIYSGNSPITFSDPYGLFSLSDFFGGLISGLELLGGIALDILSGGALAEGIGGALIGAGISGLTYSIESGDDFSWSSWGEEEGIGAAIGAVTAGLGAAEGSLAESVGANFVEDSLTQSAAKIGTRIIFRSATGMIGGVGQTVLENAVHGQRWNTGLGQAAWLGAAGGAIGGAIGEGVGAASAKIGRIMANESETVETSLLTKGLKGFFIGSATGFAGDATVTLISNAINHQPLTNGLWQTAIGDIVGGTTAGLRHYNPERPPLVSKGLRHVDIDVETGCMSSAIYKSFQEQGIHTNIQSPEELRTLASNAMQADYTKDVQEFQTKFNDMIKTSIESGEFDGFSAGLKETVDTIRSEWANSDKTLEDVIHDHVDEATITDYFTAVKKGEAWGNFLELTYLGHELDVKYRVQGKDGTWHSLGPNDASDSVYLQYSGDHYDLFLKKGIVFFRKTRVYEPIDHDSGWGAGKRSRQELEKSASNTEVKNAAKSSISKAKFSDYEKLVKKLKDKKETVSYVTSKGVTKQKEAFGPQEFGREIIADSNLELFFNDIAPILDLVNQGGSYTDLNNRCSFSLLIESNHMPPFSVVNKCFGYSMGEISCVSMLQQDHRFFPSTGRFSKLSSGEIIAVTEAIKDSKFPAPASKIDTFKKYHEYLESLFEPTNLSESYAKMLEVEIRCKYLLFGDYYNNGIHESIDYAKSKGFITAEQAAHLKGL
jgi:RHS repeat-associated protein